MNIWKSFIWRICRHIRCKYLDKDKIAFYIYLNKDGRAFYIGFIRQHHIHVGLYIELFVWRKLKLALSDSFMSCVILLWQATQFSPPKPENRRRRRKKKQGEKKKNLELNLILCMLIFHSYGGSSSRSSFPADKCFFSGFFRRSRVLNYHQQMFHWFATARRRKRSWLQMN